MKTQWWVVSDEWWETADAPRLAVTQNPPVTTHNRQLP